MRILQSFSLENFGEGIQMTTINVTSLQTPSNSKINIVVNKSSLVKIVMFNALGQMVLNLDIPLNESSNIIPFALKNLSNGIYQTNIFIGDESFSRKLNISK
jgi:hypothetical protein